MHDSKALILPGLDAWLAARPLTDTERCNSCSPASRWHDLAIRPASPVNRATDLIEPIDHHANQSLVLARAAALKL